MTVQLALISSNDGIVASARAAASDPDVVIDHIEFYTTVLPSGPRLGPFPPDAAVAFGVYEKSVLLTSGSQTKVEAVAILADGSSVLSSPSFITLAARSAIVPPPSIRSLSLVSQWWRVNVSVVPGSAFSWKCWVRRDAWPTLENTPSGTLVEKYLRFEGNRDELAFSLPIPDGGAGTWYAVAIGYSSDGREGPRVADVVEGTYDGPVREALVPAVLQVDGVEQRQTEVQEKLRNFTDWIEEHQVPGIICEVGWPWEAVDKWNQVAQTWFALANEKLLWVLAWAVGEKWGAYPLQPYALEGGAYVRKPQADILETAPNLSTINYKRGVNVAGAEFAAPVTEETTSWFSNINRGTSPAQYQWNGLATYQYMFGRGHILARIPFRWERIQPVLGAALDPTELQRMRDSIAAAAQAGLQIILDVHNYGAYWLDQGGVGIRHSIGTPQVTFDHFADLWARLAAEFNTNAAVIGYGLMNEPVNMTGVSGKSPAQMWETAAQRATDAIRAAVLPQGQTPRWIMVGGYQWSGTWSPGVNHGAPFVTDPANKVMYEAHQYFDYDSSGKYSTHELNPTLEENWIRWEPNVAMWDIANDLGEGKEVYSVEVFRAGLPAPLDVCPIWKRSVADAPVSPCVAGSPGCGHKTYEYRILVTDTRDGSQKDYAASISGSYQ